MDSVNATIASTLEDLRAVEEKKKNAEAIVAEVTTQFEEQFASLREKRAEAATVALEKAQLDDPQTYSDAAASLRSVLAELMATYVAESGKKTLVTDIGAVTLSKRIKAVSLEEAWPNEESDFIAARIDDIRALVAAHRFKYLDIVGGVSLAKDFEEISAVLGHPLRTVRVEESESVTVKYK